MPHLKTRLPYLLIVFTLLVSWHMPATAEDAQIITIRVVKNDNLINICRQILEKPKDWRKVARLNRLKSPYTIYPGQQLEVAVAWLKGLPVEGRATFVQGEVHIQPEPSEGWRALKLNDAIKPGNRIKTGPLSAAEITYDDGIVFLLRADTQLTITATRQKRARSYLYDLYLTVGRAISKIRRATGRESRFTIETPSAVATARGTEFRATVDTAETSRYETLEGEVEIAARRERILIAAGEGTLVEKGRAPMPAQELLPPPAPIQWEALYRSLPVSISFAKVTLAQQYHVIVSADADAKAVLRDITIKPDEPVIIDKLEDGTYYLQTRSIDKLGLEGPPSPVKTLAIRVNPLPPFIQTPLDQSRHRSNKVEFTWLKPRDAVAYDLQIATDTEFNQLAAAKQGLSALRYKTDGMEYGHYHFRVRSVAADGYQGIWSDTVGFELVAPPPIPEPDPPEVDENTIHLRWKDQGPGISYQFLLAADEAFSQILVDTRTEVASIAIDKPEKPGHYFVKIRGISADGYAGQYCSPQELEIKAPFSYAAFFGALGTFMALALLF